MATVYTQAGEEIVADLIDGTDTKALTVVNAFIGWGEGNSTATKADTALDNEASEDRASVALSQPAADKNEWIGTLTAIATRTITNAGLFNSSSFQNSGLVVKGDFTGIALAATGDKIEFTISLEQT